MCSQLRRGTSYLGGFLVDVLSLTLRSREHAGSSIQTYSLVASNLSRSSHIALGWPTGPKNAVGKYEAETESSGSDQSSSHPVWALINTSR